jgi:protein-ribulosamine 3-kinase
MSMWDVISNRIVEATGTPFVAKHHRNAGGGCINATYILEGDHHSYFVKTNSVENAGMFEAEAEGLDEINGAKAIRAPRPICHGMTDNHVYLVLEYIDLASCSGNCMATMAQQLAQMHRKTATHFGWKRGNTIGTTPQINLPESNWVEFWRNHRLAYQLDLANRHGGGKALQANGEQILEALPAFFTDYQPIPSLLHGDLWGGNHGMDGAGNPVIYDPAVYYGDREADIAMTELFGGFNDRFYAAYREAFPMDPGYKTRKTLYNLYHILNHYNLFGGGYASQAQRMMDMLLAEVR